MRTLVDRLSCLVIAALVFPAVAAPQPAYGLAQQDRVGAGSELRLAPEAPRAGTRVSVEYSPLGILADESELVLRGHFRTAADTAGNRRLHNRPVATLKPATGGVFTASFDLPDAAVYASFVVEDVAGRRIDANGERQFELLVRGEDARPVYPALIQRAYDFSDRNSTIVLESLRRAMEHYPDSLPGWLLLREYEERALGADGSDTMRTWHAENFERIHARFMNRDSLPAETLVAIARYGWSVADSARNDYWTTRLFLEAPRSLDPPPEWNWTAAWFRWQQDGDSDAALEGLETHWPAVEGKATGIAYSGLAVAVDSKDVTAVDRWARRVLTEGRGDAWSDKLFVAAWIATLPARRERGKALALEAFADLQVDDLARHAGRPLGRTVDEYGESLAGLRAQGLTEHAELLASGGLLDEAIDALETAATESVLSDFYLRLGELKLKRGDRDGAARAFAFVASDPGVASGLAYSLPRRLGYRPDNPAWQILVDSAKASVIGNVLADTVRWTPAPARISDRRGGQLNLSQWVQGKPTVLHFWALYCGPCIDEIPEWARLRKLYEPRGIQFVSVTIGDPPGPETDERMRVRGVTLPVYYDLDEEARDAFGVSAIPASFVLDADGQVRFAFSDIAAIPRQLEVLELLAGASAKQ